MKQTQSSPIPFAHPLPLHVTCQIKRLVEHEWKAIVMDIHLWINCKSDGVYTGLKESNLVFSMISVLHEYMSMRYVMENLLSQLINISS